MSLLSVWQPQRLWQDSADTQAGLSLGCSPMLYKVPKSDMIAKAYCKAGLIFAVMIWLKIKTGKHEVFRFLHS